MMGLLLGPPERDHRHPGGGTMGTVVRGDPWATVVKTVVRTLGAAVVQAGRGWDAMDGSALARQDAADPMGGMGRVPFAS
jgi:hypothetical protein